MFPDPDHTPALPAKDDMIYTYLQSGREVVFLLPASACPERRANRPEFRFKELTKGAMKLEVQALGESVGSSSISPVRNSTSSGVRMTGRSALDSAVECGAPR
jgi:hypothetical protein